MSACQDRVTLAHGVEPGRLVSAVLVHGIRRVRLPVSQCVHGAGMTQGFHFCIQKTVYGLFHTLADNFGNLDAKLPLGHLLDSVVKLKACYALLTYNEERPYGGTSKA